MAIFRRRVPKTLEERRAEQVKLIGPELAGALPEDDRRWWTQGNLVRLNLLVLLCCTSAAALGYDGVLMNALQISPSWQTYYNHPENALLGAMNAMMPVGKVTGALFVAPISNRLGRKTALIIGLVLAILGAALQAGSINFIMLIISRLILGVGSAFMSQPSPILITELAYPTHRGKVTALYQTFFFFGAIAAAWISFGTLKMVGDWSWRIPTLLQGATPLVQICCCYWLPESPRWLVAKGRSDEARRTLVKYHADGDESSRLVTLEMLQIEEAIRQERESKGKNIFKVLLEPANRWRVTILLILGCIGQWAGNTVLSYYLGLVLKSIGITDPTDQSLINGGLQIFNMIACICCGALMVDRLGRRTLFLWSAAGMCISYCIWTALNAQFDATGDPRYGTAVIPFLFIFNFHYAIAITPLMYSYPTEIFPYELRSFGVAAILFIGNLALIVGQLANPVAMARLSWRYYILFCIFDALFFVAVWFVFPETKGRSLEEIALIFERNENGRLLSEDKVEAALDEKRPMARTLSIEDKEIRK